MFDFALDPVAFAPQNNLYAPLTPGLANGAALERLTTLLGTAMLLEAADQLHLDVSGAQGESPINFGDWNSNSVPGGSPLVHEASPDAAKGHNGEWTAEDDQMLDKCVSASASGGDHSAEFNKIAQDFGQTTEGNCASVACIKAALDKYGTKVFTTVQKSGDGYQVQLQDGKSVSVSRAELAQAAQAAKFKGKPNEAKSMAVLMYAVIAKQAAAEGHEGARDFGSALKTLANGENPKAVAKMLGLKTREVSVNEAGQAPQGAVAWSGRHAVYTAGGTTDKYGQNSSFDGTDTHGRRLTGAFEFV